jgi:hypothetical protein
MIGGVGRLYYVIGTCGKEIGMGVAVKETANFKAQQTKKGFKIFAKTSGVIPKYGYLVSAESWEKLEKLDDDAFDKAIVFGLAVLAQS